MKPPTLYDHQEEVLKRSWNRKYFALLLEQGCGKTRILLDTARWLWQERKIRAMVVIAPNGVHRNWTEIEIPIHAPKILPENILTWDSRKSKAEDFAANPGKTGLLVRAYNVEGFSRDGAPASLALRKFLKKFPDTLLIIDESTRIKTPTAKRTRVLISLGRLAQYRRIATGMLVAQTPFDVYSQFQFLEKGCLGFLLLATSNTLTEHLKMITSLQKKVRWSNSKSYVIINASMIFVNGSLRCHQGILKNNVWIYHPKFGRRLLLP